MISTFPCEILQSTLCGISLASSIGVHFKKWCLMQSKIKAGAIDEYKKEVEVMLEVALSYLKSHSSSSSHGDIDKSALSSPTPENIS
jgi:hypothetical protein